MQQFVAVLLIGVVVMCSGGGFSSDNKALYESDMSQVSNNCPRMLFLMSREISGWAIDLIDAAQCNFKR